MKENIVMNKSYVFAIRIINLYKFLNANAQIYALANQILRSGTSIGALMKEADEKQYISLNLDCEELLKLLISIVKTTKESIHK